MFVQSYFEIRRGENIAYTVGYCGNCHVILFEPEELKQCPVCKVDFTEGKNIRLLGDLSDW